MDNTEDSPGDHEVIGEVEDPLDVFESLLIIELGDELHVFDQLALLHVVLVLLLAHLLSGCIRDLYRYNLYGSILKYDAFVN